MKRYYTKEKRPFILREMKAEDCRNLSEEFRAQGWNKPVSQYERYLREQEEGIRQVIVAEVAGKAVGYVTLLPEAGAGPFAGQGIPEICDFNVLILWQRQGIGSALLDRAEELAAEVSPVVCLGVGLHHGYGAAQRLYVKRGYNFDGSGVWYKDAVLPERAYCCNDDDLILYLSKTLVDSGGKE